MVFLEGWFKDTLRSAAIDRLALMRLDGDMYRIDRPALEALYPKLASEDSASLTTMRQQVAAEPSTTSQRNGVSLRDGIERMARWWTGTRPHDAGHFLQHRSAKESAAFVGRLRLMRLPRVSVCLLTYKRAAILPRSLDSLLAQTHSDFELIINDDCSPDGTEAVCREYARRDHRVRYFRNAHNLRYAGNQNAAVLRATTDYVAMVHDGDVYRRDMLRRWTEALHEHAKAALVFNAADRLDAAGRVVGIYRHDSYADVTPGGRMLDEMLSTDSSPICGIVMLRRTRVLEAGPFDPRLPMLADVDMWMRLLLRNDVAYVPEPLYAIAPREPGHHINYENWRVPLGARADLGAQFPSSVRTARIRRPPPRPAVVDAPPLAHATAAVCLLWVPP